MNFASKKMHLFAWVGCALLFSVVLKATENNAKYSVFVEDEDCMLVEEIEDGSIKNWGEIRPGQTIDVPDGVLLELENLEKEETMTLIEEESPDLPINIGYQESVTIVESDTGDIGFEKETVDGELKLITSAKHYNDMYSSEEPVEIAPDTPLKNNTEAETSTEQTGSNQIKETKKTPIYTRTIEKLPPKRCDDLYDDYETSTRETPIFPEENSWAPYVIGGGFATLGILWCCYLMRKMSICSRYLAREDTWSSWKCEEPYEVLLQIEPQYLVDDLIRDINTTYYQEDNPVELFLEDVTEEYDTLCKWIQFRITVDRLWIPLGPDFYTMEHRLYLLNLMRKTVHYWRAQQLSSEKK